MDNFKKLENDMIDYITWHCQVPFHDDACPACEIEILHGLSIGPIEYQRKNGLAGFSSSNYWFSIMSQAKETIESMLIIRKSQFLTSKLKRYLAECNFRKFMLFYKYTINFLDRYNSNFLDCDNIFENLELIIEDNKQNIIHFNF